MENQKSFLETWKEAIYRLRDEGLVTQEEIDQGFDIPMQWLYSSGIEREDIIVAIRNLYQKEFPDNTYLINRFKRLVNLTYREIEGIPSIEVSARNRSVYITEEEMESHGWKRNVTVQDFIAELMYAKTQGSINRLITECDIPREQATLAIKELNKKQIQSDLYAMPHILREMPVNFEEYYKYIQEEIEIRGKNNGPIVIRGGIIEQEVAERDSENEDRGGHAGERQSAIYSFEERNEIFENLEPKRIVKYDGMDRKRQIVRDAYTLYIYENPQEKDGYLGISEPLEGDKETRVFYISRKDIEELQGDEDIDKFWTTIGEMYIKMSRTEFSKEEGTYRFRHKGSLEDYRQKIEGVIHGANKDNPQQTNVTRASLSLFGARKCKEIVGSVTKSGYNQAKESVFGDREITQEKEGEDITND